jgi:multicomponent Na+:H+ antiporter subunit D
VSSLHPALVFFAGAILTPLFPRGRARNIFVILVPIVALLCARALGAAETAGHEAYQFSMFLLDAPVNFLRVDKLSTIFAYVFTLNATAAFIYAFHVKGSTQHVAAQIYIGSALGAVYAGDAISLYMFWEVMAIASVMLILARGTEKSRRAGIRYIVYHVAGGMLLFAGIMLQYAKSGTFDFGQWNLVGKDAAFEESLGTWLMMIGIIVNAAVPPLHTWLSEAYPEATISGGVILSAYTTKTAVYALIRGFPGWEVLALLGSIMAIYGVVWGLMQNDIRRVLAYSIVNQVGFMVAAVGIGNDMALNGATAHAFTHIMYKALLWMAAGAVLYRVGISKMTELGGLYKTMPLTMILMVIGGVSIAGVPFFSGFASKGLTLAGSQEIAAGSYGYQWVWLCLEIASIGVFLDACLKLPYFVFFAKDHHHRPAEAPQHMLVAMVILALFCVILGVYPQPLYNLLPNPVPAGFTVLDLGHVWHQFEMLLVCGAVFFAALPLMKKANTIALDVDWFIRVGGKSLYSILDAGFNGLNKMFAWLFLGKALPALTHFAKHSAANVASFAMTPVWVAAGLSEDEIEHRWAKMRVKMEHAVIPIGGLAALAALYMGVLVWLSRQVAATG